MSELENIGTFEDASHTIPSHFLAIRKKDGKIFQVDNLQMSHDGSIHYLFLVEAVDEKMGVIKSGCYPHNDFMVYQRIGL